jgi:hypothetical protein
MAAGLEGHADDPSIRYGEGEQRCEVRGRARVRLYVDRLGACEEGERSVTREFFDAVGDFAAGVVAAIGVTLRVLVGDATAARFADGRGAVVLGGDERQGVALAAIFALQPAGDFGVLGVQGTRFWIDLGDARTLRAAAVLDQCPSRREKMGDCSLRWARQ